MKGINTELCKPQANKYKENHSFDILKKQTKKKKRVAFKGETIKLTMYFSMEMTEGLNNRKTCLKCWKKITNKLQIQSPQIKSDEDIFYNYDNSSSTGLNQKGTRGSFSGRRKMIWHRNLEMQKETKHKRKGKCFGKYEKYWMYKTIIFKGFKIYINLRCMTKIEGRGSKMELKCFKLAY